MAEGCLAQFDGSQGNAMFVSHQWSSIDHPDPHLEQFKALQDAIRNAMSGTTTIWGNISSEMYDQTFMGQPHHLSAAELSSKPLFLWYDFFSCPQSRHNVAHRRLAITSIPWYVDKCEFFVILCPLLQHADTRELLNRNSWESRAWCRLERATRALSAKADMHLPIEIHSAAHQEMAAYFSWFRYPVGEGHFTVESDRQEIAVLLRGLIQKKLQFYLSHGHQHSYRIMSNLQRVLLRGLPIAPHDALVPGFVSDLLDPASFAAAHFMYQNGFQSLRERDEAGWTPVCYAALDGNPMLILTLLEQRADVNDKITKGEPMCHFAPDTPILHISASLTNNGAIKVLLANRADVDAKDGYGATALLWAALSNNVEGIKSLVAASCDPTERNMIGYTPFIMASAAGSLQAMGELLKGTPREDMDLALHAAMRHGEGGTARVVSTLIEAGADVDHQQSTPFFSSLGILFSGLSMRHRWKQSTLSTYAYHHDKATPLMCSVITSSFEATAMLLAAGARTDLRNSRGCTAADIAVETSAPDYILSALHEDGDARAALVMGFSDLAANCFVSQAF